MTDQPTLPLDDVLDAYAALVAADEVPEWADAFAPTLEEQQAEEAEPPELTTADQLAWDMCDLRDELRDRGVNHGGRSLSYQWRLRTGRYISRETCSVLADRGQALQLAAGARRTHAEIKAEEEADLQLARKKIRAALHKEDLKPRELALLTEVLVDRIGTRRAKSHGTDTEVLKISARSQIETTNTEVREIGPNLRAALALAAERNEELTGGVVPRPALTSGDVVEYDDDTDPVDAEIIDLED